MKRRSFTYTFTKSVTDLKARSGYRIESFPVTVTYEARRSRNSVMGIVTKVDITGVWHGVNNYFLLLEFEGTLIDIQRAAETDAELNIIWEGEVNHV
jgi:hypothetical protein